jgi:hypothetical protein
MIGKNLIKHIEELHQIVIYKIHSADNLERIHSYLIDEEHSSFSKTFEFNIQANKEDSPSVMMLSKNNIVTLTWQDETNCTIKTIYEF